MTREIWRRFRNARAGAAVATGGRASPLAIHFAASLADARVARARRAGTPAGGGEFDLVFNGGRLVLAAPRGGRRERDAWAEALRRAAAACVETPTRDFLRDDVSSPKPFSFSAALDSATRATLAEAKRVAGAMRLDFGDARSVTEDARLGDASAADPPERVLVLDRFWRSAALGVGAHFLFNFSAEVVPETDKRGVFPVVRTVEREDANGACSSTSMSSAMPWRRTWIRAYAVADETAAGDSVWGVRVPR